MARLRYCYSEVLPFAAMVMVECTNVGLSTLYKAAVSKGLSYLVFMVYSYAISALLLLPLSYIFHRKTVLPPFAVGLLGKFFVLGFLGSIAQVLGYRGIAYSSPTLGSAMSNLTPATTFILAILFSVIGSIIISMGFYIVTWAKTKEEEGEILEEHVAESSSNANVPLLKHLNVSTEQKIDGA